MTTMPSTPQRVGNTPDDIARGQHTCEQTSLASPGSSRMHQPAATAHDGCRNLYLTFMVRTLDGGPTQRGVEGVAVLLRNRFVPSRELDGW